jgi:hypothetical protein
MWMAMEPPSSMTAGAIIRAKVELLKKVKTLTLDDAFLGQFGPGGDEKGYLDDPTVPEGSACPTFAACAITVDNERWRGVPFLFTAAKGMDERLCELRVRFKPQSVNKILGVESHNELVMRVQPDESLYMTTVAKEPGITAAQVRRPVVMDMSYKQQFEGAYVGDAYERMFLNAALGDQSLFVSAAELVEAWRIFTPLLHKIDESKPAPVTHPFGKYPAGYHEYAKKRGVEFRDTWQEYCALNPQKLNTIEKVFAELDDGSGAISTEKVVELAERSFATAKGSTGTAKRVQTIYASDSKAVGGKVTLAEVRKNAQTMSRLLEFDAEETHDVDLNDRHAAEDVQEEVNSAWCKTRRASMKTDGGASKER